MACEPAQVEPAAAQEQKLQLLGEKLNSLPDSKDALLELLQLSANCLSEVEQLPLPSVTDAMKLCINALAKQDLLKHEDMDVKVLVATCISEITRITAPEPPYGDDILKDIFSLIVGTFGGLADVTNPSFERRVVVLETLARYRSCLVMLDLELNDLIHGMIDTFFKVVRDDHSQTVIKSMQTIIILIIDESEEIQENLISIILAAVGQKTNQQGFSAGAHKLSMNIIEHCSQKLEPFIKQFLEASLSGDSSFSSSIDHHEVIFNLYQCAPHVLTVTVPYITGELLADELGTRAKSVELLGRIFSLPGESVIKPFQPLFSEFLKRLSDRVVEVRLSVIEHLKNCLISNPRRSEALQIIHALSDRLLDYDETVRKQVVSALCDVLSISLDAIPLDTIKLVAERLRDKSLSVKGYTLERLSDLYRLYCEKSVDAPIDADAFEWIPGKILKCIYDKDFRSETIELSLCATMFPLEFPMKGRAKHWVLAFSYLDKVEVKALEQILAQKQRVQQEIQKYLSLRLTNQDQEDMPDLQKRIAGCFRSMSRLFNDPEKAEDSLNVLHLLKDANVWKILTSLIDSNITFRQSCTLRNELLTILEEGHELHEFVSMLSVRCSYLLVSKEFVKEIISEAKEGDSTENTDHKSSCMDFLTIVAGFFPDLFSGCEEELVHLLKEENDTLKEGIAHILSKAGWTIREQLAKTSSSIDLLLQRLCLEGTRKQAKYSVQALAAITKDDGLKSLSVLYKRLVDTLEEKVHLPSILQSLGCIAQIAMPIFETREDEVKEFINKKILEINMTDDNTTCTSEWGEAAENCLLKIYAVKTLVKSFLPSKDAHARPGIEDLISIIKNIFCYGDSVPNSISSSLDKAHLRLASAKAVLRLSKQWDQKIPFDVFYMTLRISEDGYPQVRKQFLTKVHQYIKERVLDAKFACAFPLTVNNYQSSEYEECKQNLVEVVQICRQLKMRQISVHAETNFLPVYPEYILAYLVHSLAHDPSCPPFDEDVDVSKFGPIYWPLHLLLTVLLDGYESSGAAGTKNETMGVISSIFHSIKCSEDLQDVTKTKISHTICDLGLSLASRLTQDQIRNSKADKITLPPGLYVDRTDIQSENSAEIKEQVWSGCQTILSHFESLKFEKKETQVESGVSKDDTLLNEIVECGDEVTLGKMLKILKIHKSKEKKQYESKTKSFKLGADLGNEDDVLDVVREINLDSLEKMEEGETSKPGISEKHHQDVDKKDKIGEMPSSSKKPIEKSGITFDVSAPKRKRSIAKQRPNLGKTDKENVKAASDSVKIDDEKDGSSDQKHSVPSADRDSLIKSLSPTDKTVARKEKKRLDELNLRETNADHKKHEIKQGSSEKQTKSANLNGSVKKPKRKSIFGLEKCSSGVSVAFGAELVNSRIKVWWPLDKQYYKGVVRSYYPEKKKHLILYDDGEKEVLNMVKERWEFVSDNNLPEKKRQKHEHGSSQKQLLQKGSSSSSKQSSASRLRKPSKLKDNTPRKTPNSGAKRIMGSGGKSTSHTSNDRGSDLSNDGSQSEDEDDDPYSDGEEDKEMPLGHKRNGKALDPNSSIWSEKRKSNKSQKKAHNKED